MSLVESMTSNACSIYSGSTPSHKINEMLMATSPAWSQLVKTIQFNSTCRWQRSLCGLGVSYWFSRHPRRFARGDANPVGNAARQVSVRSWRGWGG